MSLRFTRHRRRLAFAAIGCVALIALYLLVLWNPAGPYASPTQVSAEGSGASTKVKVDNEPVPQADHSAQPEPARRIVQVPDTRTGSASVGQPQSKPFTSDSVAEFAAVAFDAALDGNLSAASALTELLRFCSQSVARDERSLEAEIQSLSEEGERLTLQFGGNPAEGIQNRHFAAANLVIEHRLFATEEQTRVQEIEWLHGCNKMRILFTQDMRRDLEHLAREGHVTARYLYAMWNPDPKILEDGLTNFRHWQLNAVRFTQANLEAGEVAGLLAYLQSFQSIIFTGYHQGLATLLLRSVHVCGFQEGEGIARTAFDEEEDQWAQDAFGLTIAELNALVAEYSAPCR